MKIVQVLAKLDRLLVQVNAIKFHVIARIQQLAAKDVISSVRQGVMGVLVMKKVI